MLTVSGPLSELVYSSLLAESPESVVKLSKEPTSSRVLQQALTLPTSTQQFRRQFTTRFQGHMVELALHSSGSHVVDSLWSATKDIFFVKERMAQELAQDEMTLRDPSLAGPCGGTGQWISTIADGANGKTERKALSDTPKVTTPQPDPNRRSSWRPSDLQPSRLKLRLRNERKVHIPDDYTTFDALASARGGGCSKARRLELPLVNPIPIVPSF